MAIHIEHPTQPEQLQAWAEILWRVEDIRVGVDALGHGFEGDRDSLWALAYVDDQPAGIGVDRPSSRPGSNFASIRVLPEVRGQGVGNALLAAISEHARAAGAAKLWGRIRAGDGVSLAFTNKRGFSEVGRECDVMLDLTRSRHEQPQPPPGILLVSFAERPDLIPAVFDVDSEVSVDVPSHGTPPTTTFERWSFENLEGPGALPEACFAALDGDKVVGYAALRRRGAGAPDAENLLTAVRRPWRERGIATALKRAQIERAHEAGIERIFTSNDETNVAMRGVNKRLGYEPQPERIIVSGAA